MKRLLPLLLVLACAELETFEPDTCGNNVVESPREDCDLITDPSLGEGLSCGEAGAAGECRYLCTAGADCPRGWACFDDGICRHAQGTFELPDEPQIVLRADEITLANFMDGDAAELGARLGADFTVYSLDEDSEDSALFQVNIGAARGAMSTVTLDSDGERSAVLLPAASRFGDPNALAVVHVMAQSGDRLVSAIAPRRPITLPRDAKFLFGALVQWPDGVDRDELLVAARMTTNVGFGFISSQCPAPPRLTGMMAASPDAVFVPPAYFEAVNGGTAVVLGTEGSSTLAVATTSVAESCVELNDLRTLALPAPLTGFRAARIDAGPPALLVDLNDERVAVLRHDGTSFGAPTIDDALGVLDERSPSQPTGCDGEHLILAAGNLQPVDDGRDDFVTENGIYLSTPNGYTRVFTRTRGDAWAEAAIGDFDRDGRPDIAVSTRSTSADCSPVDLQFLRQGNQETFTSSPVPNVSLPRDLRIGDFDGDGIDDVAAVEGSANGRSRISVFFGDTKEALEDKSSVGGFGDVRGLVSFQSREGVNLDGDRLSDLVVFPDDDKNEAVTLFGTPRRSLLAPMSLGAVGAGLDDFLVTSGRLLDEDSEAPDLLALGASEGWIVPGESLRRGGPPRGFGWNAPFDQRCAVTMVSDRDAPQPVFAVDGYFGRDAQLLQRGETQTACAHFELRSTLMSFEPAAEPAAVTAASLSLPVASRVVTQLVLADLDGNDIDEVIVHFAFRMMTRDDHAVVYWNLERQGDRLVSPKGEPEAVLPTRRVLGVAALNVDADEDIELAAYTADGLVILDPEDGQLKARENIVVRIEDTEFDDGGIKIRSGQVDEDGLDDLVILSGERLFVLPAVPRR